MKSLWTEEPLNSSKMCICDGRNGVKELQDDREATIACVVFFETIDAKVKSW